jgi:hypothetical protein
MKMIHLPSYALGIAAALISLPTYASTQAQPQNLNLVSAKAQLTRALNSKSIRQGQTVMAKLSSDVKSHGQTELPKGSMLMGKVAQVQNGNANGNHSEISIVFNEARLPNGREVPIKATLLGAYPPAQYGASGSNEYLPIQPHVISSDRRVDQEPGMIGAVSMHSAVQSNVSGTFSSKKKSISLRQGTQLQLAIAPENNATSTTSGS